MSDPFVGEIQAFPFAFATGGFNQQWLPCLGQLLLIQRFTTLFSLIGTTYGGNGTTNYALPNLSGTVAIGQGSGPGLSDRRIGDSLGSPTVTLTVDQLARHSHNFQLGIKTAQNSTAKPVANLTAIDPSFTGFAALPSNVAFAPNAIMPTGGGQPHNNLQPSQVLVWCIAYAGILPTFS